MAEVAGFFLAVVPLIINAIEDYEALYQHFSQYKNFEPLTRIFQLRLLTEKTKFVGQFQNLLLGSLGAAEEKHARELLADLSHVGWEDEDLEGKIARHLGKSADVCAQIVKEIRDELRVIDAKCRSFGIIVKETNTLEVSLILLSLRRREALKSVRKTTSVGSSGC